MFEAHKELRSNAPLTSILNPQRPYTPAARTNVADLFARIKAEQDDAAPHAGIRFVAQAALHPR